jgi:cytosine/adenosine deaminase-related metal-dependent hydrolase
MFCLCCRPSGGFFAEGVAEPVIDFARALKRRAAYEHRNSFTRAPATHPSQAEFIIRNAAAISMDPRIGDQDHVDIHVRDGVIVNIGPGLPATPALDMHGDGFTALPGLVAPHRHLLSESLGTDTAHSAAFAEFAEADVYCALRLALLELASAGVTCVHICGAEFGAGHAETAVLAHIDSGARGRYSYPAGARAFSVSMKGAKELHDTWFTEPIEHLIELGLVGDEAGLAPPPGSLPLPQTSTHDLGASRNASPFGRTLGAARQLGLDPWIGSLSTGKRADLILVRSERLERFSREDIDLVVIDGRIKKRNGVLTEPNEGLIRREGAEARARLGEGLNSKAAKVRSE